MNAHGTAKEVIVAPPKLVNALRHDIVTKNKPKILEMVRITCFLNKKFLKKYKSTMIENVSRACVREMDSGEIMF